MLKLNNVSKYYSSNEVVALGIRRINLEFKIGEFIAVTGESGSGKSTLLNVISGLDSYEEGEMYIAGKETSYYSVEEWENYRKQYIGFVFQNYNIIDSYTVLDNVLLALTIQGYDKETRKQRALELIERVGLTSHANHKASKLSGGQKQRAVIARALAKDCPIIVADEPTGNLDKVSSDNIMSLLKEISEDKLVIVVTHNYEEVSEHATRKIRLFDGEVIEDVKLKRKSNAPKEINIMKYQMNFLNLVGIALKNLIRTPRRTFFTLLVSIFIVGIFFLGWGSFLESTTSNRYPWNRFFENITDERIVVTRFDEEPFTEEQLSEIKDINRVRCVLEDDVILESTILMFRPDSYDPRYYDVRDVYVNTACALTEHDLLDGRLPQDTTEVVLSENYDVEVGDVISYDFSYQRFEYKEGEVDDSFPTLTVVGIKNEVSQYSWMGNAYFHPDFLENITVYTNAYTSGWGNPPIQVSMFYFDIPLIGKWEGEPVTFTINNDLEIGEVVLGGEYILSYLIEQNLISFDSTIPIFEQAQTIIEDNPIYLDTKLDYVGQSVFTLRETELTIAAFDFSALEDENLPYTERTKVEVNEETLPLLFDMEEKYQIAVMVKNNFDADIVLADLDSLGYRAIYPAGIEPYETQFFNIIEYVMLFIVFGFFLVVIYFVSYLVLRNIQISKKKDYLVFRSIGANKSDLNKLTIFEMIFAAIIAYIIVLTALYINEGIRSVIPKYLSYYNFKNYLFIFVVLLALVTLLANRYNKKIFSKSVITALKQE